MRSITDIVYMNRLKNYIFYFISNCRYLFENGSIPGYQGCNYNRMAISMKEIIFLFSTYGIYTNEFLIKEIIDSLLYSKAIGMYVYDSNMFEDSQTSGHELNVEYYFVSSISNFIKTKNNFDLMKIDYTLKTLNI